MLAGNAIVTLVSKKTGERFTYRIRNPKLESATSVYYVDVLTGPNNEADYTPLSVLALENGQLHNYRASISRIGNDAPSAIAFRWAAQHLLIKPSELVLELLDVFHEGRCSRCGRLLTNPSSVGLGLGPECAQKAVDGSR